MLALLITTIATLFVFLSGVVADPALPGLQKAQDKVIAVLSEVMTQDGDTNGDNGENGDENGDENGNDENGNGNGDGNGENGDGNGDGENGNENGNGDEPEDNKVRAYNTAAGFVLPAMVAQIAVDNSPVLISCDEVGADCEFSSPGNSDHAQNGNGNNGENGSDNADNGNIGLVRADQAKSNRP